MIVLLALFPLALIASLLLTVALRARSGNWLSASGAPLLLLLTLAACYIAGFVAVSADPYFDDNGLPEFIELRFRWVWAAIFGSMFSSVAVPLVFIVRAAWRGFRSCRKAKCQSPG